MEYSRKDPDSRLSSVVECYWFVTNDNPAVVREKIVPDGFPEIIFHYGDPYRINLHGQWETQAKQLLAGQLTNHFFLENTGFAALVGIKFLPTALTRLFGVDMAPLTDRVADLRDVLGDAFTPMQEAIAGMASVHDAVPVIEEALGPLMNGLTADDALAVKAVEWMRERRGMTSVAEVGGEIGVGERKLERLFKRHVGLSPKFYARVLRFAAIFEGMEHGDLSWAERALEAGFYDQSHFIRNFKEFTGEDPSRYGFDARTMANFFMRKR